MLYIGCRYGFFDMDFSTFLKRRDVMKQLSLVCRLLLVYVWVAAIMWWALPTSGLFLSTGILGFMGVNVLTYPIDRTEQCDPLAISEIFFNPVVALSLVFLNIIMLVGGLFLSISTYYDIVLTLQTPFLVFAAMVVMLTLLWCVAVSKLTPKPGTMMVDEDNLYYLPGDVLPRLSSQAQAITPKTKILVSVLRDFGIAEVTFSRSFCFAPWVFTQEARQKLSGSMTYSTLVNNAKNEFFIEYPDIKTIHDIWRLFRFPPTKAGKENSPYVWNRDTVVSESK